MESTMQMMTKILALLAIVMGRKGRKPDMLLITEGNQLVILNVDGDGFNFKPKLGKGCNESPTFKLSAEMCTMTLENTLPTIAINDRLKGRHTVTITVQNRPGCICGMCNEVIIGIPQGTRYEHISLDDNHESIQRPAARSPMAFDLSEMEDVTAFGGPLGLGMPFGLGRMPRDRTFYGSSGGMGSVFASIILAGLQASAERRRAQARPRIPHSHVHATQPAPAASMPPVEPTVDDDSLTSETTGGTEETGHAADDEASTHGSSNGQLVGANTGGDTSDQS